MDSIPRTESHKGREDAEFVRLVQAGQRDSFEFLVRRYQPLVRGYLAGRRGMRGADLDDAVQAAFISAFRNIAQLRDPERFVAFLFRIAQRSSPPRRLVAPQEARRLLENPEEEAVGEGAWREALHRAIGRLPDHMQLVLALKYGENLTAEEISRRLGLGVGSVTKTLSRAHHRLKDDSVLSGLFRRRAQP